MSLLIVVTDRIRSIRSMTGYLSPRLRVTSVLLAFTTIETAIDRLAANANTNGTQTVIISCNSKSSTTSDSNDDIFDGFSVSFVNKNCDEKLSLTFSLEVMSHYG